MLQDRYPRGRASRFRVSDERVPCLDGAESVFVVIETMSRR